MIVSKGELDFQNLRNSPPNSHDGMHQQPQGMPVVIRRLPGLGNINVPRNPIKISKKQLVSLLSGQKHSNHFWKVKKPKDIVLSGYYLVDATIQCFAPGGPGHHGALISWRMYPLELSPEDTRCGLPLFVNDGSGYVYFGHYIEPRYSEKMGFN